MKGNRMNDVKAALRSMGVSLLFFSIFTARILGSLIAGLALLFLVIYVLAHYTWIVLSVLFLSAMCFWFKVELDNARADREWKEMKGKRHGKS